VITGSYQLTGFPPDGDADKLDRVVMDIMTDTLLRNSPFGLLRNFAHKFIVAKQAYLQELPW
jgi:hypothetical protein